MRREVLLSLYRFALRALPEPFRARYADDMAEVFADVLADANTPGEACSITVKECGNVLLSALRMRLTHQHPLQAPAMIALLILLTLTRAPESYQPPAFTRPPLDSVDFRAKDPAGEFTLHVRHGRAIAGSIDNHRVSRRQIIQTEDSIRVVNTRGRVLFAVAYDREQATIQWSPRPSDCRGRTMTCGVER